MTTRQHDTSSAAADTAPGQPKASGHIYQQRSADVHRQGATRSSTLLGSPKWPGILTIIAGTILADGAVITAAYRGSSPVPDDRFSFPWQGATAVTTSLMWGLAQAMLCIGLVVYARQVPPTARWGKTGAHVAVAGGGLFVGAHVSSAFAAGLATDDTLAIVVGSMFGLGTVLLAIGLVAAGLATRRRGNGSRRTSTPLALGGSLVLLVPLQFTPALVAAVAVYAAAVIAFGVGLLDPTAEQGTTPGDPPRLRAERQ